MKFKEEVEGASAMKECKDRAINPIRVFIVDDEQDDVAVWKLFLELREEFRYTGCAPNGQQALEFLQASPEAIDIILLDIYMPEMDGIDFLRQWRSLPKPKPKIFVLSAYGSGSQNQLKHQVMQMGVSAYFEKGYPLSYICERMLALCKIEHECDCDADTRDVSALTEELLDHLLPLSKSSGRYYITAALQYLLLHRQESWRVCEIYDRIAEEQNISAKSVDRAIRQAIKEMAEKKTERWDMMTQAMGCDKIIPSNKVFLEMLKREVIHCERNSNRMYCKGR